MYIPAIVSDVHLHGTPEIQNNPGIRFYFSSDSNLCSCLECLHCAYSATGFGTCLIRNSNHAWDSYFLSSRTIHRNYVSSLRLLISSSADVRAKIHTLDDCIFRPCDDLLVLWIFEGQRMSVQRREECTFWTKLICRVSDEACHP
jgi:hypothetical protein